MAGDYVSAAFLVVLGNGDVEDAVERVQFALNASAIGEVDEGIAGGGEDRPCSRHRSGGRRPRCLHQYVPWAGR